MMRMRYEVDALGVKTFVLQWTDEDLLHVNFDSVDEKALSECAASDKISDKLLGLELLARRVEQSLENRSSSAASSI